jgi:hypothetical protein
MNLCDDIRAQLPLYLGGDLEAPLAEQVRAHLEAGEGGCPGCARALAEMEGVRAQLLELPKRSPAPHVDVWPQVRLGLAAGGLLGGTPATSGLSSGTQGRSARTPAGRLLRWRRVAAAAAAVALVAVGVQLAREAGRSAPVTGQGAADGDALALPAPPGEALSPTLPVVAPGGLRRLTAEETPLHDEARPFVEWMRGWNGPRLLPGTRGGIDPSRPTFASDRSLR